MPTQLQRLDDSLSPWDQVGPLTVPAHGGKFGAFEGTLALSASEFYDFAVPAAGRTWLPSFSGEGSVALSPWAQLLQDRLQESAAFSVGVLISRMLSGPVLADSKQLDPEQKLRHERVLESLAAEPVEDGYCHPAEKLLEQAMDSDFKGAANWIRLLILDRRKPALAAAVLRCLGRLDNPLTEEWRASLVETALASPDVEVRDAAAQVAELWNDERSYEVLRQHIETEPWLRAYIEEVLHGVME